jgi:phage terminase large subunit-like protein
MADPITPELLEGQPTASRASKERAALVMAELAKRRAMDPLRKFQPHAKQRAFIDSVLYGTSSMNWFLAANRAGKSDAGAYCVADMARFGVERGRGSVGVVQGAAVTVKDRATSGWVSALDFPSSRDVVQPKLFNNGHVPPGATHEPFIPEHEVSKWDKESQILTLKNGSIIGFKSAESGRSKYQGAEKDYVHFDEAHPKDIYEEAVIRVGAHKLRFFCTATILPDKGGEEMSWVFNDIIAPYLEGSLVGVGVFNASIYDNPHVPPTEIVRLESLYPPGSPQHRIRLGGELIPGIAGSRVYSKFARALHVIDCPPIHTRRPLCWCWDFNVSPMVSLVGQRENGVFRFHDEFFFDEGSISDMCEAFRERYGQHEGEVWIYGDATGQKRISQTRQSDYNLILQEMKGFNMRMKVPAANPAVFSRINAMQQAFGDSEGKINLLVDRKCKNLVADFEQVIYDTKNKIKKVTDRGQPYFWRTHVSDAGGYWIAFEAPVRVTPGSNDQVKKVNIKAPNYGRTK